MESGMSAKSSACEICSATASCLTCLHPSLPRLPDSGYSGRILELLDSEVPERQSGLARRSERDGRGRRIRRRGDDLVRPSAVGIPDRVLDRIVDIVVVGNARLPRAVEDEGSLPGTDLTYARDT